MTVKRQIKKTKKQSGSGKNRKGSTRSKSGNTSSLKRTSSIKQEVSPVMNLDVGEKENPKLTISTEPAVSRKKKDPYYSPIGNYITEQINAFEKANPGKTLDPEDVWLEKEKQIGIPKPEQVVPAYKNMSIKEFNNTLSQITNIVSKNLKNKQSTKKSQTKTQYSRDIPPPSRQIQILTEYLKTEPQGPLSEIISYMVNPNKKGTPGYIRPMLSTMYNKT